MTLREILSYSRQTFLAAVSLLKKHKFVDVKKSGTSNVYLINKELYWKSQGTNHRYAKFGAKIIISESEQDEAIPENFGLQIQNHQEVIIKQNH